MRKWMMLLAGLSVSAVLLAQLCRDGVLQYRSARAAEPSARQELELPLAVEGTQLVAVELAEYEGPFWEDGSGQEVAGICALVIENRGGIMASQGAVTLETEDARLVFEFSCLPPGARVLVPERNRAPAVQGGILLCKGWSAGIYPEITGAVTARAGGMDSLVLTNHTTQPIPNVTVIYKSYDRESDMYIGGVSHSLFLERLQSGESRIVNPPTYAAPYSKVVCVLPGTGQ